MINCKNVQELYTAYIDKELDDAAMKKVEEHLASCVECREAFKMLSNIIITCGNMEEAELPADFSQKLHQRLNEEKQKTSGNKLVLFSNKYLKIASSIAAGLLLVVLLKDALPDFQLPKADKALNSQVSNNSETANKPASAAAYDNASKQETENSAKYEAKKEQPSDNTDGSPAVKAPEVKSKSDMFAAYNQTSDLKNQKASAGSESTSSYNQVTKSTTREDTISRSQDTVQSKSFAAMDSIGQKDQYNQNSNINNIMPVNSALMTLKAEKADKSIELIKNVTSNLGIKDVAVQQDTIQTPAIITAGEHNSSVIVRTEISKYDKFKEALISAVGSSNIKAGEIVSRDISTVLKELNVKLDVLNQSISEMEVRSIAVNTLEFEKLKTERANTLGEIQKLISDAKFIKIKISIVNGS